MNWIWTKIRNLDEILDEIGDFGRTKNDMDNVFLLSLLAIINEIQWHLTGFMLRRMMPARVRNLTSVVRSLFGDFWVFVKSSSTITTSSFLSKYFWTFCSLLVYVKNAHSYSVSKSKSQQLWSSESSQGESLYHQHDKSTKTQMAWACSPTWCVIARRSRRQDDWETYEREKETTADEQHMRGIQNSKETSWRQMSVMCLSDGSHWPATTAEYQKKIQKLTPKTVALS